MKKENQYLVSNDVIVKAKKGDTEAFSIIYKIYLPKIYFIARQFAINDEAAKDLTQDIFMTVYEKVNELQEPKAFHSWLQKIAYHKCLNYNRGKYRVVNFGDDEKLANIIDFDQKAPLDILQDEKIMKTVEHSLSLMNDSLKSVGLLRYFEGKSLSEIAEFLDIPKGTVKSRLSRVRENLKKDLRKQGITPRTYVFVIAFPNIIFKSFSQLMVPQTLNISSQALILLKKGGSATFRNIGLATSLIVLPIYLSGITTEKSELPLESIEIKSAQIEQGELDIDAQIEEVNFNEVWTNKPVFIDIKTTSDHYDEILINGISTMEVFVNGIYAIQLMRDGKEIDRREIVVSNIDSESPYGVSQRDGNQFTVHLYDDTSGVNPDSIVMMRNGKNSKDYIYDSVNQTITVQTQKSYGDIIYVSDYAGNIFEIRFE